MRGGRKSAISAVGRLAVIVALAGCAGAPWKQSQAPAPEPTTQPAVTAAPAESGVATATRATDPAAMPTPSANGFRALGDVKDVRFRPGQLSVVKADHPKLDAVVRWLKQNPDAVLLVEGHTDDLGTQEGNVAAGTKRAESVRGYLLARGIEPSRVSVSSAGSERPLCMEKTDACRARNRRAEFLVKQP